ncbi:PREDICTED: dihydrolipoyllysine-residue acetyltransferase component of pyruvate dehydrogenase complex, mitochondrial-like [Amphimedon queenslandica]|uniref:Acetyltransferase component of pyruvate dehydrogenase complex n=1 Tax=Amphimedon queenslandica TaxID=400682 RepID=A0A1X7VBR7_AMPQE|nr:PREDICTED: dihydrolipoyllysine-residue acetyltransferase component of pyruvate dehydrogenase complex, mitochondrial-like [Amphimedon queenslandica]|eukprot:XP_003384835.1 PREDICTED: dihydrolipoyllysine-residue acetyltransferase component of pyruvate dehydrogenase complex, mitochondrial-like [Amphimedon queenslandica]
MMLSRLGRTSWSCSRSWLRPSSSSTRRGVLGTSRRSLGTLRRANIARNSQRITSTLTYKTTLNSSVFVRSLSSNLPSHTEVVLPALSPTMDQGTIVKWEKEVGDKLEEGDIIAQVETDKATMDMETPGEGYLARIIVPAGSKDLPLGKLLAIIVEEESDIEAFKDYAPSESQTTPTPTTPAPAASEPVSEGGAGGVPLDLPSHTEVVLPALSPTMDQGTIVKWEKEEGEKLEEGDIIAQVETDKATMDMETPGEGYLAKIIVPAGSKDLPLGKLLAIIVEDESDVAAFKDYSPSQTSSPAPPMQAPPTATPTQTTSPIQSPPSGVKPPPPSASSPVGRIIASPYAKKLASEKSINLQSVSGTGPGGRIVARDVLQGTPTVVPASVTTPTPGASYEDIQLSGMRKTIATRLMESKRNIPHYYLSIDITMDDLLRLRSGVNSSGDIKLSVTDFLVKASGLALMEVPQVNSSWMESYIRQYNSADVSVAVSTEGGLITPIITGAENKGLKTISTEMRDLSERARSGRLQPHEFQGGTFTISNLGMYGIRNFSAVINPPQSCILAVGATQKRVIVDEDDNKNYKVASVMSVTMSCDHRVVDGAVGAQWLSVFKSYIEKPFKMLL